MLRGHWIQVRPEDLSRIPIETPDHALEVPEAQAVDEPKVELSRRQALEQRLKASPTDLDAFMELARIYRAQNRPNDARRILEQAIQIFPEEPTVVWECEEAILARSLQQLREVTDLSQRLKTADAHRELKRAKDDWAHRRTDVCRARLNRDPSLNHLRIVLAESLLDSGMYDAAIEELEPVLDIDELSPTAYLIQGRCQLAMGKDLDAMSSLRAAAGRRSVVAPVRLRIAALRLLCETAEKLGVSLSLRQYQQHLQMAEQELAKKLSVSA